VDYAQSWWKNRAMKPSMLCRAAICSQFVLWGCVIINLSLAPFAFSQEKANKNPQVYVLTAPAAPTSGYRAEFLEELLYYEQRFNKLAEAIPEGKYSWRPGDGARSIGELVAKTAVANDLVWRDLEGPLKPGANYGIDSETLAKEIMAVSGDKPKVLKELKNSFASMHGEVLLLNDGDADKPQKIFGKETTVRGSFLLVIRYWGEHLGALIAYARMNGITLPWAENTPQD
jgi:hypothetical protein